MKDWMKQIPKADLVTYRKAGYLEGLKLGQRAALLVVDVTYGFTGSEGLTLEKAQEEFQTACGPVSWETMPRIARLIGLFRQLGLAVIYTRSSANDVPFAGKATKTGRSVRMPARFNEIPAVIAPRAGEWVLEKTKASAFFQTPLSAFLIKAGIDTVVVCGVSTSGCVRATTVDAFSHGFLTFVVDDCCFDRIQFAHAANLFDMHAKYASVVSLSELEAMVGTRGAKRGTRIASARASA